MVTPNEKNSSDDGESSGCAGGVVTVLVVVGVVHGWVCISKVRVLVVVVVVVFVCGW